MRWMGKAIRWIPMSLVVLMLVSGCGGRKSSLLLERQARGPMEEEPKVAKPRYWTLNPVMQTLVTNKVEVIVNHASRTYLKNFFKKKTIFGSYAGANPYFAEHLVFYVKIANQSDERIRIDPSAFILIDDRQNQYAMIGTDYVTAYADARAPVSTTTRGLLSDIRPGYFGFSLPVGRMVASKPQGRFALLRQSSLQEGYLYPGVTHDGMIAFWNPSAQVTTLTLLITSIKTNFNANDEPRKALEFPFQFSVDNSKK